MSVAVPLSTVGAVVLPVLVGVALKDEAPRSCHGSASPSPCRRSYWSPEREDRPVLLGVTVLRERLNAKQALGLTGATATVVLMAGG